ncbi:MAG: hypothetical protein MUE65_04875, partial [Methanomassiliicoccales archaeon]|nr:hypothetical protein [Methanomassiliicoccales archaeon]
ESIVLDDEVSRKIESTIVRSNRDTPIPAAPVAKPEVLPPPPVARSEEALEPEPPKAKAKEWPERRLVTSPPPAAPEDKDVKMFVETMIGEPIAAQAAAVVNPPATEVVFRAPTPPAEAVVMGEEVELPSRKSFLTAYSKVFLVAGVSVYLITLALYSLSYLDVALGWALAIVGALLLTIGVSTVYDSKVPKTSRHEPTIGKMDHAGDEVVICPRCHEEVSETDARCPSCGAAFSR